MNRYFKKLFFTLVGSFFVSFSFIVPANYTILSDLESGSRSENFYLEILERPQSLGEGFSRALFDIFFGPIRFSRYHLFSLLKKGILDQDRLLVEWIFFAARKNLNDRLSNREKLILKLLAQNEKDGEEFSKRSRWIHCFLATTKYSTLLCSGTLLIALNYCGAPVVNNPCGLAPVQLELFKMGTLELATLAGAISGIFHCVDRYVLRSAEKILKLVQTI